MRRKWKRRKDATKRNGETALENDASLKDDSIIESIRAGRRDDYAGLVRRYQGKVMSLCLSILRDPVQAEEAAHETFVKAFFSLDDFRHEATFSTWLYRIAVHQCQDMLRARKKQGEPLSVVENHPMPDHDKRDDADLIRTLLSQLPERDRSILELREAQGLCYDEIAAVLQLSLDAVKARLRRARHTLQKKAQHFFTRENVKIGEAPHDR